MRRIHPNCELIHWVLHGRPMIRSPRCNPHHTFTSSLCEKRKRERHEEIINQEHHIITSPSPPKLKANLEPFLSHRGLSLPSAITGLNANTRVKNKQTKSRKLEQVNDNQINHTETSYP